MCPRTVIPPSFSVALLLPGLLLAGLLIPIRTAALTQMRDFTCPPHVGTWDETTATCTAEELNTTGWGLTVPPTMTLVVSRTFMNEPDVVGPVVTLIIAAVTVDGHLVIANQATNYGPVYVNGRLTISGTWNNQNDSWNWGCGSHGCGNRYVEGVVTNRGKWLSNGHLSIPFGAVNEGDWWNSGTVDAAGSLVNRGHFTNTGVVTTTDTIWNWGQIHSPGLLVNQGLIYNKGVLSGTIDNEGVIYSTGILSGTIEGDGSVYLLQEQAYLPIVSK